MGMEHGLQNPKGPPAGDNPNIVIPATGVARFRLHQSGELTPRTDNAVRF